NQGVIVLNQSLSGGMFTAANPQSVYASNSNLKVNLAGNFKWIIPPYHHVVVFPNTAASSADFPVYLLGMDLIKP
ncbi:unnamed protein product, partial [marine sediment metagenome]